MKKSGMLLITLAALLCLVGWTAYGQKGRGPKVKWEYRVIGHGSASGEQELNASGAQGWELVGVANDGHTFYLKRRK